MASDAVFINFQEGVGRMMNNVKLFTKLLGKFINDAKLDKLEEALAGGDFDKAYAEAHTIKGLAANLAMTELASKILELEAQIKAKSVNPAQVETVKNVFAKTMQEAAKIVQENG
ncbi:MAG: Hpt domain-containing protein [Spirochaetes bacterium]|nr:Hpt domain-containing protein [Spirochaetota bacterium]